MPVVVLNFVTMFKTCYKAPMFLPGHPRITSEPDLFGGQPAIRGMRIRVSDLVEYFAAGDSRETLLKQFPFLEDEDIIAALTYAAEASKTTLAAAE
jgi:uncharacterized protein (DUF433 family)